VNSDTRIRDQAQCLFKEKDGKAVTSEYLKGQQETDDCNTSDQEADRRSLLRVNTRIKATFELGNRVIAGEIYNLNAEGAFLRCRTIAAPFTLLKNLHFTLPADTSIQVAEAIVIWNNPNPCGSLYPEGMGLFFQAIDDEQVELIRAYVHQTSRY
jgi:hypothetical protein